MERSVTAVDFARSFLGKDGHTPMIFRSLIHTVNAFTLCILSVDRVIRFRRRQIHAGRKQ